MPPQELYVPKGFLDSMRFDGVGDYISGDLGLSFDFGEKDFTVEAWRNGDGGYSFFTMVSKVGEDGVRRQQEFIDGVLVASGEEPKVLPNVSVDYSKGVLSISPLVGEMEDLRVSMGVARQPMEEYVKQSKDREEGTRWPTLSVEERIKHVENFIKEMTDLS